MRGIAEKQAPGNVALSRNPAGISVVSSTPVGVVVWTRFGCLCRSPRTATRTRARRSSCVPRDGDAGVEIHDSAAPVAVVNKDYGSLPASVTDELLTQFGERYSLNGSVSSGESAYPMPLIDPFYRRALLTTAVGALVAEVAGQLLECSAAGSLSGALAALRGLQFDTEIEVRRAATISVLAGIGAVGADTLKHLRSAKGSGGRGAIICTPWVQTILQHLAGYQPAWDRIAVQVGFAACYTGLFQPHVFHILNSYPWTEAMPGNAGSPISQAQGVVLPLLLNQLLVIPTLYWPSFFLFKGLIREISVDSVAADLAGELPKVMKANLAFWLPAQGIQFASVPAEHHSTYVAAMGIFWNAVLACLTAPPAVVGEEQKRAETADVISDDRCNY